MASSLHERLAAIARRSAGIGSARGNGYAPDPAALRHSGAHPESGYGHSTLPSLLPGEVLHTTCGPCWRHLEPLSGWSGADPCLPGRLAERLRGDSPADLALDPALGLWKRVGFEGGLFLDLETTGLSATPVFLAGVLSVCGGTMMFQLLLARDYREEKALLTVVAEEIERHPVVITFNGKSYDVPFLRERLGRLRVGDGLRPAVFDLLHPARRRWKRRLPDCRLKTLEERLCGRKRIDDVDGREIPALYHRFVRNGDFRPLSRVLRHNLMDLYALLEVTDRVLSCEAEDPPKTQKTTQNRPLSKGLRPPPSVGAGRSRFGIG